MTGCLARPGEAVKRYLPQFVHTPPHELRSRDSFIGNMVCRQIILKTDSPALVRPLPAANLIASYGVFFLARHVCGQPVQFFIDRRQGGFKTVFPRACLRGAGNTSWLMNYASRVLVLVPELTAATRSGEPFNKIITFIPAGVNAVYNGVLVQDSNSDGRGMYPSRTLGRRYALYPDRAGFIIQFVRTKPIYFKDKCLVARIGIRAFRYKVLSGFTVSHLDIRNG